MQELIIDSSQNLNALYRLLGYKTNYKKEIKQIILSKDKIAESLSIIALWLHKSLQNSVMEELLEKRFDYLLDYEEEDIRQMLPKFLSAHEPELTDLLTQKLQQLAESFSHINLEGFAIFGIHEYKQMFSGFMEECIDQYLAEQDYYDFLEMLRIYVELEEAKSDIILIVFSKNGKFSMMNKDTKELQNGSGAAQEDILLQMLIDLVPERIIVYGAEFAKNKNLLQTLQYVFRNRLIYTEETAPNLPK